MKQARMQFGGFVFPVNPARVTVSAARRTAAHAPPYGTETREDLGAECRMVTGSGLFPGANGREQWRQLQQQGDGGPAVLFVPGAGPMRAVLSSLTLEQTPQPETVGYAFVFTEVVRPSRDREMVRTVVLGEGESLWHAAARCGAAVERLLALNPEIPHPWAVHAGQEVKAPC